MSPTGPRSHRRSARLLAFAALGLALESCGGGSSSPTGSTSPTPPPEVYSVTASVYYDVNRNNVRDQDETVSLEGVVLQIGNASGRTEAGTGKAVVQGVPAGTYQIVVQTASLPPFFVGGAPVSVTVPTTAEALVPLALPIGQNTPFRYLSSGDSISQGTGSDTGTGYRSILQSRLNQYYGVSTSMFYRGGSGGTTDDGAARIARDLSLLTPAYTLIGWGTNDWNFCGAPSTCPTVANLRSIVRDVKAASSLPCVATILPPNTGYDSRVPPSRAAWVVEMNGLIKAMALQEGALVADLHTAFTSAGNTSDLFDDHLHPNQHGYEIIAQAWFDALTHPRGTGATAEGLWADAFPMLYSGPRSLQPDTHGLRPGPSALARR